MNLNEEYLEGQDTEVTDENTSVTLTLKNEKDEAEVSQDMDSSAAAIENVDEAEQLQGMDSSAAAIENIDETEQPQNIDSSAIDDIAEENNDCDVVEQAEATEEYIDCNEVNRESDSAEGKMDADANLSPKEYMEKHYSIAYSATKEYFKNVFQEKDPIVNDKELKPDSLGMSKLFAHMSLDWLRFDTVVKSWRIYNGFRWVLCPVEKVKLIIMDFSETLYEYIDSVRNFELRKKYEKIQNCCRDDIFRRNLYQNLMSELMSNIYEFDQDPNLFNVLNGTLNLKTMKLSEHNPNDFITKLAPVFYNPNAGYKCVLGIIKRLFCYNEELVDYLARTLGYALLGKANEECVIVLETPVRSGKGTLFTMVRRSAGDYVVNSSTSAFASINKTGVGAPREDILRLRSSRVVLIDEPDKDFCLNGSLIKLITGQDVICVRGVFAKHTIEFTLKGVLFIATNFPIRADDDLVFKSNRVKLLKGGKTIPEDKRNPNLKEIVTSPYMASQMLNFMLYGLKRYQEFRLTMGTSMKTQLDQLAKKSYIQNNSILAFRKEALTKKQNEEITIKDLYAKYQQWCGKYQVRPCEYKQFLGEMRSNYYIKNKRLKGVTDMNAAHYPTLVGYCCSDS